MNPTYRHKDKYIMNQEKVTNQEKVEIYRVYCVFPRTSYQDSPWQIYVGSYTDLSKINLPKLFSDIFNCGDNYPEDIVKFTEKDIDNLKSSDELAFKNDYKVITNIENISFLIFTTGDMNEYAFYEINSPENDFMHAVSFINLVRSKSIN